ncbi:MAG: DMT family transporter [Pseudomonadota bacterium]
MNPIVMNQKPNPSLDLKSGLMLLLLSAVWGASFFFVELALPEVPPLTITLHRVIWALPILGVVLLVRNLSLPRSLKVWGAYMVMGALNNAIPFSLIFWGQTKIDAGLASILNATTAMTTAVIAGLLLKDEPLTARKLLGAILGFAGVVYIMGPQAVTSFDPANLAQLAVLAATFSYALAGVWGRTALSDLPSLVNASGMLVGSAVLMLPIVLIVDGVPSLHLSHESWGALLGLAILSTSLAYVLYFAILARAGAANLLLATLLVPVFAIMLGAAFLGERVIEEAWIGFGIIVVGFIVTDGRLLGANRTPNNKSAPERERRDV